MTLAVSQMETIAVGSSEDFEPNEALCSLVIKFTLCCGAFQIVNCFFLEEIIYLVTR